jgi:hypothetical protein
MDPTPPPPNHIGPFSRLLAFRLSLLLVMLLLFADATSLRTSPGSSVTLVAPSLSAWRLARAAHPLKAWPKAKADAEDSDDVFVEAKDAEEDGAKDNENRDDDDGAIPSSPPRGFGRL